MTKMLLAPATTGVVIPKADFRALEAGGAARTHLDRYTAGLNKDDEPLKYIAIKRAFDLLTESGLLSAKIDQFCFMAHDEAGGLLNWIALGDAPTNNGMVVGADGFEGNGTSAYINTGFDPSTGSPHYQLDSAHLGIYAADVGTPDGGNYAIGHTGASLRSQIALATSVGNGSFRVNCSSTAGGAILNYGEPGHYLAQRNNSADMQLYHNNAEIRDNAVVSSSVPAGEFHIARRVSDYGTGTYAGWHFGSALTADEREIMTRVMLHLARAFVNVA